MAKFNSVVEFILLKYALMNLESIEVSCRKSTITMKQFQHMVQGTQK